MNFRLVAIYRVHYAGGGFAYNVTLDFVCAFVGNEENVGKPKGFSGG